MDLDNISKLKVTMREDLDLEVEAMCLLDRKAILIQAIKLSKTRCLDTKEVWIIDFLFQRQ